MRNSRRHAFVAVLTLAAGLSIGLPKAGAADIPKLAGSWTWTWKDRNGEEHRHVLEVEGMGTKLAARERFDDEKAVKVEGLKLEGKSLRFAVVRDGKRADYSGVVADSSTINGTVLVTLDGQATEHVWKAKLEPEAKVKKETESTSKTPDKD
ncbi:hypothetical protein ACYOEI_10370 [Singulisphaera rosea]